MTLMQLRSSYFPLTPTKTPPRKSGRLASDIAFKFQP